MRSFLSPILVAVVFTLSVPTQTAQARYDDGSSQPVNSNCPIGKEPVDGKTFGSYKGETVGFCCPGCDKQFQAWSEERKDAFLAAAKGSGKLPVREPAKEWTEPYNLPMCVVSGELLGSMGDPVVKHYMGREVRLCCDGCVGKFEKNQVSYAREIDDHVVQDQLRFYPLKTCVVTGKSLVVGDKDAIGSFKCSCNVGVNSKNGSCCSCCCCELLLLLAMVASTFVCALLCSTLSGGSSISGERAKTPVTRTDRLM